MVPAKFDSHHSAIKASFRKSCRRVLSCIGEAYAKDGEVVEVVTPMPKEKREKRRVTMIGRLA